MKTQQVPARDILDAYTEAVARRDVEAFMALYDEDCHRFDTWDQFEQTGSAGWREIVTDWFGSHPDDVFETRFDDVHTSVGDTVAFIRAVMTFSVVEHGKPAHRQVNRYTACLERKNGAWKIVHEHSSMPISYESGAGTPSR